MDSLYKPSGRVSPLFVLYFIISLVIIAPIFSFIFASIFWFSSFIIVSLILMILCVFIMILLCDHFCINKGKVRNKAVATVAALIIGLLFSFLCAVFYSAYGEEGAVFKNIYVLLLNPAALQGSFVKAMDIGFVISRAGGLISFEIRGIWLIIVNCAGIIFMQIFFIMRFRTQAGEPFIESQHKWAEKIKIKFNYIQNKPAFIEKMKSFDIYYIDAFAVHEEEDTSHCLFELFPMEQFYCLTATNQKAEKSDKGKVSYEDDTVVEYLIITKSAGDMLLAKQYSTQCAVHNP